MVLRSLWLALICAACQATGSAPVGPPPQGEPAPVATEVSGDVRVLSVQLGMRQLDEDLWAPVEDQLALALEYAYQREGWLVGFEGGLCYALDEQDHQQHSGGNTYDITIQGFSYELYGGLHASFHPTEKVRPFVGAGLTVLTAGYDVSGPLGDTEDATSLGFYAHGGLGVRVSDSIEIGADLRAVLGTDVELNSINADADYTQLSVFVGFHF